MIIPRMCNDRLVIAHGWPTVHLSHIHGGPTTGSRSGRSLRIHHHPACRTDDLCDVLGTGRGSAETGDERQGAVDGSVS